MDHVQLWVIPSKGATPIIVDPWLVIPMIHLKSNENHDLRYRVEDYPLATSGYIDNRPYTKVTRTIDRYDPVFTEAVQKIENRERIDALEKGILTDPTRTPSVQTHAGPDAVSSGIYSGHNWAVRRSRKIIYKNAQTGERLDLYQHDLNRYFDQRLKILLVEHFELLTRKSGLAEFPYRGGAAFSDILNSIEDGNAKPLMNLLSGLPESTASKFLGEFFA